MKTVYLVVGHDTTDEYMPQENPVVGVYPTREQAEKERDKLNAEYSVGIIKETLKDDYPEQEDDAFGEYCYYRVWEMPLNDWQNKENA